MVKRPSGLYNRSLSRVSATGRCRGRCCYHCLKHLRVQLFPRRSRQQDVPRVHLRLKIAARLARALPRNPRLWTSKRSVPRRGLARREPLERDVRSRTVLPFTTRMSMAVGASPCSPMRRTSDASGTQHQKRSAKYEMHRVPTRLGQV